MRKWMTWAKFWFTMFMLVTSVAMFTQVFDKTVCPECPEISCNECPPVEKRIDVLVEVPADCPEPTVIHIEKEVPADCPECLECDDAPTTIIRPECPDCPKCPAPKPNPPQVIKPVVPKSNCVWAGSAGDSRVHEMYVHCRNAEENRGQTITIGDN